MVSEFVSFFTWLQEQNYFNLDYVFIFSCLNPLPRAVSVCTLQLAPSLNTVIDIVSVKYTWHCFEVVI